MFHIYEADATRLDSNSAAEMNRKIDDNHKITKRLNCRRQSPTIADS